MKGFPRNSTPGGNPFSPWPLMQRIFARGPGFPHQPHYLVTVHHRHVDIRKYQVVPVRGGPVESDRLHSVRRCDNLVARRLQDEGHQHTNRFLIVSHQYGRHL